MAGHKLDKVASILRQYIGETINKEYPQLVNSLLSISYTRVSPDLSWADVYCTSLECIQKQQEQIDFLQNKAPFLRRAISQKVSLRRTPALRFHIDATTHSSRRIEELLLKK